MPMVSSCRTFYWLALGGLAIASDAVIAQQDAKVPMTAGAPSLVEQAIAYEHGEGVPKDQARAAVLYCEAARKGDPEAQMGLGWMFANGRGVARDEGIAASLFALAAAAGNPYAQTALRFLGGGRERLPECMHEQATPELAEGAQPTVLPDPFADLPPKKQKIVALVTKLAPAYTIDTRLALAIIAIESNFEPQARSPKNARGLMQLIPFTAERFHVKNVFDMVDNIRGGLSYLRWLLSYYQGEVALAAAAYNAGEGTVDRYRGIPPYPETRQYVRRVLDLFGNDHHPYDPTLVEPSQFLAPLSAAAM